MEFLTDTIRRLETSGLEVAGVEKSWIVTDHTADFELNIDTEIELKALAQSMRRDWNPFATSHHTHRRIGGLDDRENQSRRPQVCDSTSPVQQLKGGGVTMEKQQIDKDQRSDARGENIVAVSPTKSGNGFKMCVNGVWLFTSRKSVERLLDGGTACVFGTIASGN